MEFYQLKTFVEVARTKNLTEASSILNTSQPAASAHIKALEKELGFDLFLRTPKGMFITERGRELLGEAVKVLESLEVFYRKADELFVSSAPSFTIGLNTDGEILKLRQMIDSFSKKLPNVEFHFAKIRSEDLMEELKNSNIDAGFYYGKKMDPSLEEISLKSYKMVLVYPNTWELDSEDVNVKDFLEYPWIWTTRGCPFYKKSMGFFKREGISPKRITYVDDEILIGKLVESEIGCSLLAEPIADMLAKEKKLKVLRKIDLDISLYFGYKKHMKSDSNFREMSKLLSKIWSDSL